MGKMQQLAVLETAPIARMLIGDAGFFPARLNHLLDGANEAGCRVCTRNELLGLYERFQRNFAVIGTSSCAAPV